MKPALGALAILSAVAAWPLYGQERNPRILKLDELTWTEIDALDRERTMFILPLGMLEEHGPHLPVGTDTIGIMFEADRIAARVSRALPGWTVVMMPPIHYGESGANEIGNDFVHPGTYGIRHSTLRSLVADVGARVAENGFKWIFAITGHGAPTNGIAVNEACDFVSESFGVTMLHVSGLFRADPAIQARGRQMAARHFSEADMASFGLDVHAGVAETSAILAIRPDLVPATYKKLPGLNGHSREELQTIARTPGWLGYLSSPARATAAYGRDVEAWWVEEVGDLMVRAASGQNLSQAPRAHDTIDPAIAPVVNAAFENERAFESRLQTWLDRRQRK
jgi:creatinine amidohydrolase